MLTDATLSGLLLDLYGCALRPEQWPMFLARLCAMVEAPQAALVHHQVVDSRFVVAPMSHGVDPEAMVRYNAYYGAIDPWTEAYKRRGGFANGTIDVLTSDQLVPDCEFRNTEFCVDFGEAFAMVRNVMVVAVPPAADATTALTFPSGRRGPEHSSQMLEALRILAPHLQQAQMLGHTLASRTEHGKELGAAFDRVAEPVAILGPDGMVRFMNDGMRRLTGAAQPLILVRGGLRFREPSAQAAFRRALRGFARWNDRQLASVGPAIPLAGATRSGRVLMLSPMPVAGDPAKYLVMARVPSPSSSRADIAAVAGRFGLTPTETRIAALLSTGRTVAEIADLTKTRSTTVRWHLKQAFAKTGARNQAQLVALMHSPD
jgi:DNA-binding CsgD family transcriptional regulator